jgi:hypothetical protein
MAMSLPSLRFDRMYLRVVVRGEICEQRMPSMAFPPLMWMRVCTCLFHVLLHGMCSALSQFAAPCSRLFAAPCSRLQLDNLAQVLLV